MFAISIPRILRYAVVLGVAGTVITALTRSVAEAAAFLAGALLSLLTIQSWSRIADRLNPEAKSRPSAAGSGLFLALRYLLIAAAIYVTIKVFGVTPVAMLLGLLTSFAAVLIEIARQASRK
jgi:hypothetical protein